MKNKNYITLMGWMFNDLKLRPNQAAVFGLIHGFSQDGQSVFKGSLTYISDTLNLSRRTVITILKTLVDGGLIDKKSIGQKPQMFNEYNVNINVLESSAKFALGGVKNAQGGAEIAPGDSVEIAPNSNTIHINIESGTRALDYFKKERPDMFNTWCMQNLTTIENKDKFIADFNDKYDEENKVYDVKLIHRRLSRFARAWVEFQQRFKDKKEKESGNNIDVNKIKWS